jgi:hypothetical protein
MMLDGEIIASEATDGERGKIVGGLVGVDNAPKAQSNIPPIITVDATASQIVSVEHPNWSFGSDMDPETTTTTRQALLEPAARHSAILLGYHRTYPGVGSISKEGETFKFSPMTEARS